jgi:hypothetical protein
MRDPIYMSFRELIMMLGDSHYSATSIIYISFGVDEMCGLVLVAVVRHPCCVLDYT